MDTQVTQSSIISIQTEPPKTPVLDQKMEHANSDNNNSNKVDDSAMLASEQKVKRKRGRPRKYDVNGSVLSSTSSMPSSDEHAIGSSSKKSRGRPRGSANKNITTSTIAETGGKSFKPHVIKVNKGEDVVSKILAFSKNNVPKAAVSVISATGAVSSVLIRNTNHSSTPTLKHEGCFEILSLSGSYTFVADGDSVCKKGSLTILLSEPDGSIFGGVLEGSMIAATPIQLIVGTFKQNTSKKSMSMHSAGPSAAAPNMSTTNSNPDSERVLLIEGSKMPAENLIHATTTTTTTGVSDNVNVANQNMQSASVNGVGLDSQAITDKSIGAADNNNANV